MWNITPKSKAYFTCRQCQLVNYIEYMNKDPILASDVVGYDVARMCFESSQNELNKTIYCQICTFTVELAILGGIQKEIKILLSIHFIHQEKEPTAEQFAFLSQLFVFF